MPVGKMHYARHWFAAVRYENNIWAIGGELTGTTELFHSETNGTDIIKIENFKPPKGHAAVILPRHDWSGKSLTVHAIGKVAQKWQKW